ncbi:hypothetical protein PFISCL1PPCAC_7937, partial [Pristionchus fissidentatus]
LFDFYQTVFVGVAVIITIPFAVYVYTKLLFCKPFSSNFTFKLIVVNGLTILLCCITALFSSQLSTFPFMYDFYVLLQRHNLSNALEAVNGMINGIGFHTALFVALNRLKTVISWKLKGVRVYF